MESHVEAAVEAFRKGQPVCLFDAENRELDRVKQIFDKTKKGFDPDKI